MDTPLWKKRNGQCITARFELSIHKAFYLTDNPIGGAYSIHTSVFSMLEEYNIHHVEYTYGSDCCGYNIKCGFTVAL